MVFGREMSASSGEVYRAQLSVVTLGLRLILRAAVLLVLFLYRGASVGAAKSSVTCHHGTSWSITVGVLITIVTLSVRRHLEALVFLNELLMARYILLINTAALGCQDAASQ